MISCGRVQFDSVIHIQLYIIILFLMQCERLVIEDTCRRQCIVYTIHDNNHFGVNRSLDMLTAKYYGLTQDVKNNVCCYSSL